MNLKPILTLVMALAATGHVAAQQTFVVNEVMVANIDMFIDQSYNYGGWIELYNPTSTAITLTNMYVSDDETNLKKFRLPSGIGTVPAGGFKTLWFDHYSTGNEYSSTSSRQINFKLNPEGGTIYISSSAGALLVTQQYPPALTRISYARTTDGGDEWRYTGTPTPTATNTTATFADMQLEPPMVDRNATVYTTPFQIHVTSAQPDATLRYTTDGSTPTLTNGKTSDTGVFDISSGNYTLRFRLFKDGYLPSTVVTRSYIYDEHKYYLPIVSITTDDKNLYSNTYGAYVDGTNGIGGNGGNGNQNSNKNRSWERPVNFEYLVPDNTGEYSVALDQEVDFEVSGGWSRHFQPNASFKLKSAKVYEGKNFFEFPIFNSKPFIKNKAIIVRNGGNDCDCRIYDAAIHEIVRSSGIYVDCQAWQPAHIIINGKYQFMFNLRETNNKNFAYSNYGIDKDNMDQFEFNGGGYRQMVGDDTAYQRWSTLASQLANNPTNQSIYQQICDLVDIDEFCNYMATECYIGSNDWLTNNNNVKGFRDRDNGRFHIVMMDVDQGFASDNMLNNITASTGGWGWGSNNSLINICANMLKHQGFRRQFIDTYCIVAGSIFDAERARQIITDMANYMKPALAVDGKDPWTQIGHGSNISASGTSLLNAITSTSRRNTRINTLRSYFGLQQGYNVKISSNLPQADIMVNNVKIATGQFDGMLYPPATLSTCAPAGYRFKGWRMSGSGVVKRTLFDTSTSWNYYDQGSLDGQTWNATTYSTSGWKVGTAPFGYGSIKGLSGSQDYNTTLDYGTNSSSKRPTYYFRKTFTLTSLPTDGQTLQLQYYLDDGCVIYVNGKEIHRYLMPTGTINYNTYTTNYVEATAYSATIDIPTNVLKAGMNTIAVEVHNTSATSSDIYWAATLQMMQDESLDDDSNAGNQNGELSLASLPLGNEQCTLTAIYEPISDDEISLFQTTHYLPNDSNITWAPIRINEVSATNEVYVNDLFKKKDWFELYNATDTPIDVTGLYLSDNESKPQKYQIVAADAPYATNIIQPGGHLIVWADKLEPRDHPLAATTDYVNLQEWHTPFQLANTDNETVILSSSPEFVAANAAYFEAHPGVSHEFTDKITYPAHTHIQSVGRYPDGGCNIYVMNRPTPQTRNSRHTYDTFVMMQTVDPSTDPLLAIEGITSHDDENTPAAAVGVYSTSGIYVGETTANLPTGTYIIRYSDGRSRKVLIK